MICTHLSRLKVCANNKNTGESLYSSTITATAERLGSTEHKRRKTDVIILNASFILLVHNNDYHNKSCKENINFNVK